MNLIDLLPELLKGLTHFTLGNAVMLAIGAVLVYLAIAKEYEPVLLLPIGFGCILANIPLAGMTASEGMMGVLYLGSSAAYTNRGSRANTIAPAHMQHGSSVQYSVTSSSRQ